MLMAYLWNSVKFKRNQHSDLVVTIDHFHTATSRSGWEAELWCRCVPDCKLYKDNEADKSLSFHYFRSATEKTMDGGSLAKQHI